MKYIDDFLNGITMYKLVMFGLTGVAIIAAALGFFGVLSYGGLSLIASYYILAIACFVSNQLFAKIFKVQTNVESAWITGFILFFVATPVQSWKEAGMLVLLAVTASASKYILVINKKHIFNPVAVSVFIFGLLGSSIGSWWVGSEAMLIPLAIFGFLVLRKVRRFSLFFSFFFAGVATILLFAISHDFSVKETLMQIFSSWPILFFGSVMLTEPWTTPPTRNLQIVYGVIVGALFGSQFHFGPLYSTPEFALIVGNIFVYIVSPRARLVLTLREKNQLTADVFEFVWETKEKLSFKAGQYLEWTLAHAKPDMRGNRRFFTIASSPTEDTLRLGVKFSPKGSSFKGKLLSLEAGDKIIASQLAGEFTLPKDTSKKLVFMAGGIGITPFRSMIKEMIDKGEKRDAVLVFSNRSPKDVVYKDLIDEAVRKVGLRVLYAVNELEGEDLWDNMVEGFIDRNIIKDEIPDYIEREFYISGRHGMVTTFQKILSALGVKKHRIKIDFFPGFV